MKSLCAKKLRIWALSTAGFCLVGIVSPAHADVFEFGNAGNWQQLNKPAVQDSSVQDTAEESLPPIRLEAITQIDLSGKSNAHDWVAKPVKLKNNPTPQLASFNPIVTAAAQQYGLAPELVDAVMWQESRYRQNAVSSVGAIGLMQLMPGTAKQLGVNPHDAWQNAFGGAAYLRQQLNRFNNSIPLALAAYNAGPGAVIKHGGIPPYAETQKYVASIMQRLERYSTAGQQK
jgi:soluble lytic murein transglycosylase-like protein